MQKYCIRPTIMAMSIAAAVIPSSAAEVVFSPTFELGTHWLSQSGEAIDDSDWINDMTLSATVNRTTAYSEQSIWLTTRYIPQHAMSNESFSRSYGRFSHSVRSEIERWSWLVYAERYEDRQSPLRRPFASDLLSISSGRTTDRIFSEYNYVYEKESGFEDTLSLTASAHRLNQADKNWSPSSMILIGTDRDMDANTVGARLSARFQHNEVTSQERKREYSYYSVNSGIDVPVSNYVGVVAQAEQSWQRTGLKGDGLERRYFFGPGLIFLLPEHRGYSRFVYETHRDGSNKWLTNIAYTPNEMFSFQASSQYRWFGQDNRWSLSFNEESFGLSFSQQQSVDSRYVIQQNTVLDSVYVCSEAVDELDPLLCRLPSDLNYELTEGETWWFNTRNEFPLVATLTRRERTALNGFAQRHLYTVSFNIEKEDAVPLYEEDDMLQDPYRQETKSAEFVVSKDVNAVADWQIGYRWRSVQVPKFERSQFDRLLFAEYSVELNPSALVSLKLSTMNSKLRLGGVHNDLSEWSVSLHYVHHFGSKHKDRR